MFVERDNMAYPIDYKTIASDIEFYHEVAVLHQEAENYLLGFRWCKKINNSFLYTNLGSTFCIFLFEILNSQSSEDNFLWVIVGDIPPMYLDVYGPKTTKQVVEDYIDLAEDWINHIENKKSVVDCYPFNAEPTIEVAELLDKKILFMKQSLLDNMSNVSLHLIK